MIPTGLIEWDASYDNLVNQYEIQYKLTSEADTEFKSIFTSVPKYEFYNAEVGTSVTIRIRAINSLNVKGAFTTATFTVNGDTTAPGVATSVTALSGYRSNTITWTNPSDSDFAKVEVYGGNTSGSGSATLIGEIAGDTFVEGGLTELQTRYYYLKTVDFSGNKSAFSAGASATTLADPQDGADGTDGADGATGTRSASGYVYYNTATVSAPSSPTLSGFNFITGQFSTISSGWSTAVSVPTPEEGKSFWAVRYAVSESTFGGSQTITKSAVFEWQNFDGLVTFTNIEDGIENNVTIIDGGKIETNSLLAESISSSTSYYNNYAFAFSASGISLIGTTYKSAGYFDTNFSGDAIGVVALNRSGGTSSRGFFAGSTAGAAATFAQDAGNSWSYSSADLWLDVCFDSSPGYILRGGAGSSSPNFSVTANGTLNTVAASIGGGYGSTGVTLQSDGTGLFNGNLVVDGSITAGGNVTAYSDANLKDNLQVIENSLDKVNSLTGYTFDRIDTGESQTGLIAQDVLKVLPEAVGYTEDGTLTLAYGNLVGLLVEAIKELKGEIEDLKRGSSD